MAEQPDWQPISRMPLIGSMIDGMLQDAEEHYETLLQASPKPHVLDDYTVGRVFEVFGRVKFQQRYEKRHKKLRRQSVPWTDSVRAFLSSWCRDRLQSCGSHGR